MFDPYRKWLGIPTKDQPPNHYRLLSLEVFESDPDVIEGAADRVMAFLRQYQSGENAAAAAKLLNEVALARLCLLKASAKSQYDSKLREQLAAANSSANSTPEEDSLADIDLGDVESAFPPQRRPPRKKKSAPTANANWIPISIIGAVILVSVIAFVIPRQAADRGTISNQNTSTAGTISSPTEKPSSETAAKPAEPSAKPEAPPVASPSVGATSTIPTPPPTSVKRSISQPEKKKPTDKYSDPSIVSRLDVIKITETAPFRECKGPYVLATPQGLIAAFIGGTGEGFTDDCIWISHFDSNEWTAPVNAADGKLKELAQGDLKEVDCAAPCLFRYPDGKLLLFYRLVLPDENWKFMSKTSRDGGKTWSQPELLPEGFVGPTRSHPQLLPDGSFMCGSSFQRGGWTIHFERLGSDGKTWTKTANVNDGQAIQIIEPALLSHGKGIWQAMCRSRMEKNIMETWSEDDGKTWKPVTASGLPNPNASIDAIRLTDGRYLVVYNHSQAERTPLNVAMSDDGKSWDAALSLEVDQENSMSPSVAQTEDGLVHVIYNRSNRQIRHVAFDPQNVRLRPIVNGKWPVH